MNMIDLASLTLNIAAALGTFIYIIRLVQTSKSEDLIQYFEIDIKRSLLNQHIIKRA